MSPVTPQPDEPAHSTSRRERSLSDSLTNDEISKLLSSSMERPEPDPMLSGPGSWDRAHPNPDEATRTWSADGLKVTMDSASEGVRPESSRRRPAVKAGENLAGVLLKSYASAVTLALIWLIYTGQATSKSPPTRETSPVPRKQTVEPAVREPAVTPAIASATIGETILVNDLEITPLVVLFKSIRTTRHLGEEILVRDHSNCLTLTLRVKNVAAAGDLMPLEPAQLRDGGSFWVDASPGPRVAMFALAPYGGWTIEEQAFPRLIPGGVTDLVLVSEPIPARRLTSSMAWRFRFATRAGGEAGSDVEVRFNRDEVYGKGR